MMKSNLQRIVIKVCCRARQTGFIIPQEVRNELEQAGLCQTQWRQVVSLAEHMLGDCRRLHYESGTPARDAGTGCTRTWLTRSLRQAFRGERKVRLERRAQDRERFVRPIEIETQDGQRFISRGCDLSKDGLRFVGPQWLLGQRLLVTLPCGNPDEPLRVVVQVVWCQPVGGGQFENGCIFCRGDDKSAALPTTVPLCISLAGAMTDGPSLNPC